MTKTAKTYGTALYDLAKEEGASPAILSELEAVVGIIGENPDFVRLVSSVALQKAERCGVIEEVFGGRVHPYLLNFLKILCENGIFKELSGCLEEYRARYNDDNGILEVRAVSAVALSDAQRQRLCEKLAASTGKTIHLKETVDPAVIGGMRVEAAGKSYDDTLSGRIERIGRSLAEIAI